MPEVREERTGWRDEGLSQEHRKWGFDCPAVDIDFLMLEYDTGRASALVEYKNEHAKIQYASHPSYQAIIDLGNRAGISVLACRYSDDYSRYKVVPLNDKAREFISAPKELNKSEWVKLLYKIRGREVNDEFLQSMDLAI